MSHFETNPAEMLAKSNTTVEMKKPHILMVPYPAQGHVMPLMDFSQALINHGIKITFVNTDFVHQRISNSHGTKAAEDLDGRIRFVSVSDGMDAEQNRFHIGTTFKALSQAMPGELKQLINKINASDDEDDVTCVVSDMSFAYPLEVADEMGIKAAAIFPASALALLSLYSIPMMLDRGIVDDNGTPLKRDMIQLSSETPSVNPLHLVWACTEDFTTQKIMFEVFRRNLRAMEKTEWLVCNSTYDVEVGAFASLPKLLPIGPLSAYEGVGIWAASFWPEDDSCLNWLDQQPEASVVYVAFGSFTVFNQIQFQELATGLELSNKSFLWVVRSDITNEKIDLFPEGFQDRVVNQGKIVSWAPQRAVLSHPSIACFVSHCGWNSTIEGISNGVPFLCWPYFADQFWNESYVCDILKVGYRFEKDGNGIIGREEIKSKIEKAVEDVDLKVRAAELKEKTRKNVKEGGLSDKNLKRFVEWVKAEKVA